jgi:hypothetical protein
MCVACREKRKRLQERKALAKEVKEREKEMAKAEAAEAAQPRGVAAKTGGKERFQSFQFAYDDEEVEQDE